MTDLKEYFFSEDWGIACEGEIALFQNTPRIFIDEGKNPNWSQIREEAGPDKSHSESCKNPVWNAGAA